ncbi:unnamed protein product [Adineta ricciae]|uniref:EGF-like domain-containing protein n=1 Tax=Adineta ricciae TaxID=249248 RepID=A0A813ULT0_ADIRI|nr:unnamed protein product [Adineta ricciae]
MLTQDDFHLVVCLSSNSFDESEQVAEWLLINTLSGSGVSYNQPKFCPLVSWQSDAITLANISTIGNHSIGIFIDKNNIVYVATRRLHTILIWPEGNINPTNITIDNSTFPFGLFVSTTGDIYIDNGQAKKRVEKWTMNATTGEPVTDVPSACIGLFVDSNNTLYCSLYYLNQVLKKSLDNSANIVILGNGSNGSEPDMFNHPYGIFVDTNFALYVADSYNHRIQLFEAEKTEGITLVGSGGKQNVSLSFPTHVVLDANRYLFIADFGNHRIIRVGANSFQCLVGCSNSPGSASNQLFHPVSLSFDSYGNMFVMDWTNNRIQKFRLATNSCNVSYHQPDFCPTASWKPNAITVANASSIGHQLYSIFIDIDNNMYVTTGSRNEVQVWLARQSSSNEVLSLNISHPTSIFVSITGDIYVSSGLTQQVEQWRLNSTNRISAMNFNTDCFGLFVDIDDNIYCSQQAPHQVVKKSLSKFTDNYTIVAGNGSSGSSANTLFSPHGIFVDMYLNLYVADFINNRIQLFESGCFDGKTVAGNSSVEKTITLKSPTGVVLDKNGYLFIVDQQHNRIVGSGPNGFRCLVGCSGSGGSAADALYSPYDLRFDSHGNMVIVDRNNGRIQKFFLEKHSCVSSYNQPKFCSSATWDPNGTTFASQEVVSNETYAVFVDTSNTIHTTDHNSHSIRMWLQGNDDATETITINSSNPRSIFVTVNGDIYVDNGQNKRVDKYSVHRRNGMPAMSVNVEDRCFGIFVDTNNMLYCSIRDYHQVAKRSLYDDATRSVAAGSEEKVSGSSLQLLNKPNGIFVTANFDLYVADAGNDRIMKFSVGYKDGQAKAGNDETNKLNYPTGIILDFDENLFILDSNNGRIVTSGNSGFRCLAGCKGSASTSNQLKDPRSLSFDSFGNIYVADKGYSRIRRYLFEKRSCDISDMITTANSDNIGKIRSQHVFTPTCDSPAHIGSTCNLPNSPCDLLKPCQNNGTCTNDETTLKGYFCSCFDYFNGTECQYDHRLCRSDTCWNNGTCTTIQNKTFQCVCLDGWQGAHCERKTNYCENVTCSNNGVCRTLLLNYTCECVSESYSGRHCEIISTKIVIIKVVSKSFAYVAILAMIVVAVFIVVMDILKYGFGIDPVAEERRKLRREKQLKKRKPVVQQFVYVNASSSSSNDRAAMEAETAV